jgi:hypothetical protein
LKELNLPEYSFRIIEKDDKKMILDTLRRKYVKLTPEEWVRQNFVRYLIGEGKYPPGLIGIEVPAPYNKLKKRVDILVHDRAGHPVMIVECKSFDVQLDEPVFEQIATYNRKFNVPYLVVTNGIRHYACKLAGEGVKPEYLLTIPLYEELLNSLI